MNKEHINMINIILLYCNLFKMRVKGQTIKNQTNNKIVEYGSQKIN